MKRFDLVIFDLDGTLIDSKLDLAHSVNATREYMGMTPLEHDTVYSYVGNGAPTLIRRALGPDATTEDCEKALAYFVQHYREHCLDYTRLYPGAEETLNALSEANVTMAILTNKPVRISEIIVNGLDTAKHFVRVYGGNSFDDKKPHPIGILKLMEETGAAPERTLMVGDSSVDIETARNAGVRSAGMTYGFQPETLKTVPPDYLLDAFSALTPTVLS